MRKNYFLIRLWLFFVFLGLSYFAQAQNLQEIEKIKTNYNLVKLEKIKERLKTVTEAEKKHALQMARKNNWPVIIEENGTFAELQKVVAGKPIYYITFNVNAAKSTRANHLNNGGSLGLNLDGQNMTAHVWDAGLARSTHQEYDGAGGNNRFSTGDGTTTLNFHSAHVTGTIIASGVQANAKGMAPQAKAVGYDWNSDTSEATSSAANGMLISNHSYGYRANQIPDQWFGAYGTDARDWDQILFNAPNYLMVVAAGNDGNDNSSNAAPLNGNSSYDKLSGHATAKNNMVVANANDANIDAIGNLISVSINSSSSEGPTDDLRIKPDITGNGTSLYSTYESSDTAYNSITGTSMASPNVAGTLLILQQHANNINGSFMRSATLKGLALHTADDAGSNGPDAIYGWGLLDAKSAAQAITNNGNESKIEELTLSSGQTYQITVDSDGVNDLMASISWTDPAGTVNSATNSSTPALVNDLDIRIAKSGTIYSPWRLTGVNTNGLGDNTVDPYERVDVANATGTYTITVTHKGSLTNGSQNYSLIVTGLTGTPVVCNATVPTGLATSNITSSSATVDWTPVPSATYDVRYRQTGTTTWTTNAISGTSTTLSSLGASTQYEVQVRSKCTSGNSAYSASVNFTTTTVQLNYCASASSNVNDEYISRVQLNTIDNTSGAQFYTDFTAVSTDLSKSTQYTISVTPTWTGTIYSEGYAVWIDYNQNGNFTDAGELVFSNAASTTTPVSGSFTVPSSATEGATRMRVSMKYNGVPTSCESFTYGEVEDYTINIGTSVADTEAPTAPSSLTASNIATTSVDLSWAASTDNVGVTGYDVYQDGVNVATVTSTTTTISGLTSNTSYSFYVIAKDAAGNTSTASNTVTITTLSGGGGSSLVIFDGSFETGWEGWTDGGGDCYRYSGSRSYDGSYSIRIRDNSGSKSAMTLSSFDVSSYDNIEIVFFFYPNSMENGEDFWVRYHDGSSWKTVASYASGSSFNNGNFYTATVNISASNYTFSTNAQFRFQCDASSNADQIYIDKVTITATSGTNSFSQNSIASVGAYSVFGTDSDDISLELDGLQLSPNPASNQVSLKVALDIEDENGIDVRMNIYNVQGRLIQSKKWDGVSSSYFDKTIDVSKLQQGLYFINITSSNGFSETQKLIVK